MEILRATSIELARLAREELERRAAVAELCRRSFADFARTAIAAGVVHGIAKIVWGPHLDAHCYEVQLQLEGWLVAYGHGTPEMIARQREAWERTGATWEDGAPEPWLRYVLVQNAIDNLPPGTLKSTIAMVLACAWIWLWCPTFIFGAASGIDANVTRDSNATRDLVRSAWYRETFQIAWTDRDFDPGEEPELEDLEDIGIRSDADSVSDWATTAGGRRYSRTVMRGFTGLHVDGLYIDDPDDADRVHNETARVTTQNRFTRAMENRVNDEHRSIRRVIQQIVHLECFTVYLTSIARWSAENPKGWSQFAVAAEYGKGPKDAPVETPYGTRDWRTEEGETLHARLSAGVLADKKLKLTSYEAQYNQNAERATDGIFARKYARFFVLEGRPVVQRRRPEGCLQHAESPARTVKLGDLTGITLSVDAANSLDPKPGAKVSAVGLLVGGCLADDRFILDDRTRVLGVSGTYQAIYETLGIWPIELVLVELKALGAGVIAEITTAIRRGWYLDDKTDERVELRGPDGKALRCKVEPFQPGKEDKVQRAHGMLPAWKQGEVWLMDGADWLYPKADAQDRKTVDEGYIGEKCAFPNSRRTDRVDAESQFMARYRGAMDAQSRWRAMSRLALVGARR